MKLMHENSLFAVLLRSRWWLSLAAAGVFGLMKLFLPASYAVFGAAPFVVIALVAAWRQLRSPSARRVAVRLEAIRGMPREEFAARPGGSVPARGYEVRRFDGPQADLDHF